MCVSTGVVVTFSLLFYEVNSKTYRIGMVPIIMNKQYRAP